MITRREMLAGGGALIVAGCDSRNPQPPAPAVHPRIGTQTSPVNTPLGSWFTQHSMEWVNLQPTPQGFQFEFPRAPASAHYIVRPSGGPIAGTLQMAFRVTGDGVLVPLQTPGGGLQTQATVRPYFQRQGDNLTGQGQYVHYRWWSAPSALVVDGSVITTVIPLEPTYWTNVNGGSDPNNFDAAMRYCGLVGFTCGSESFAGHGVQCTAGSVRFELLSFSIS